MQDSDDADTCSYIGKVGEGYYWLVNEGIDQLRTSLSKEPDATVVFNLGVNDLSEIDRYLRFILRFLQNIRTLLSILCL